MKKIIIAILVAFFTPMMLQAAGIGIYIPYSLGIERDGTSTYDEDGDYTYTLQKKSGIGIALATNLGKDSMFGYKFALEFTNPQAEGSDIESDRYDMIHTFEFGIIRSELIRVWLGPRINVGIESHDNGDYERDGVEFGIAPALGINLNFGSYLALTFDLDYKFASQFGENTFGYGTYTESVTGPTARFGLFLKFGEQYSAYDIDYTEESNGWD